MNMGQNRHSFRHLRFSASGFRKSESTALSALPRSDGLHLHPRSATVLEGLVDLPGDLGGFDEAGCQKTGLIHVALHKLLQDPDSLRCRLGPRP